MEPKRCNKISLRFYLLKAFKIWSYINGWNLHMLYSFFLRSLFIHNRPLQSINHMVCVNFLHEWPDLRFKVDSEWNIFWQTFHGNFFTLRLYTINLLRGNRLRSTFCILFWCLAWGWKPGFTSNKPTHLPTRSLLNYAAPIWTSFLSDTQWRALQTSENNALRIAIGCVKMTSVKWQDQHIKSKEAEWTPYQTIPCSLLSVHPSKSPYSHQ